MYAKNDHCCVFAQNISIKLAFIKNRKLDYLITSILSLTNILLLIKISLIKKVELIADRRLFEYFFTKDFIFSGAL